MNDEYLWQKTGKDPEIESLENSLAVFRYRQDAPPIFSAERAIAIEKPSRWQITLPLAFATCLGIVVLAASWILISRDGSNPAGKPDELVFVQGSGDSPDVTPEVQLPEAPVRDAEVPRRPANSGHKKIGRTSAVLRRRPKIKDAAPRDSIAALTKEERFAYRQLMIALSITGSKLKIVKNAIDGSDPDTVSNDKR